MLRADGRPRVWDTLRFAPGGAELVQPTESGLVDIVDGLLVVDIVDGQPAPTGDRPADPMLRAAFDDVSGLATHLAGDAMPRAIQQADGIALHSAIEASIDAAHAATTHHVDSAGVHAGGGHH